MYHILFHFLTGESSPHGGFTAPWIIDLLFQTLTVDKKVDKQSTAVIYSAPSGWEGIENFIIKQIQNVMELPTYFQYLAIYFFD